MNEIRQPQVEKKALRSNLFLLGGYLFWPILGIQLFSWITKPIDTYKPVENENYVLFTRMQPFHKTIQFRLVYHRQDGWLMNNDDYYDWAFKLKDGSWQEFYFDDGEHAGIQLNTNFEPYLDYVSNENRKFDQKQKRQKREPIFK